MKLNLSFEIDLEEVLRMLGAQGTKAGDPGFVPTGGMRSKSSGPARNLSKNAL